MAGIDGVGSSQIDIKLEKPVKESWFDAFQTFGLLAYFTVLYAIYAGFFTGLLFIALNIRKDNFMHLSPRLAGNAISDDAYMTPWMWLNSNRA